MYALVNVDVLRLDAQNFTAVSKFLLSTATKTILITF